MKKLLIIFLAVILLFTTSCTLTKSTEAGYVETEDSTEPTDSEELVEIWVCTKAYWSNDTTEKEEMLLCEYDSKGNLTKFRSNYDSEFILTFDHHTSEKQVIISPKQSSPNSDDATAEFDENGNIVLLTQGSQVAKYEYDDQERLVTYALMYNDQPYREVSVNYNEKENLIEYYINDKYDSFEYDFSSSSLIQEHPNTEYYDNGNLKKITIGNEEDYEIYTYSENGYLESIKSDSHIIEYEHKKIMITADDAKRVKKQNLNLIKQYWFMDAFIGAERWQTQGFLSLLDEYILR